MSETSTQPSAPLTRDQIPVVSPDAMPFIVKGPSRWREHLDELRERYPCFVIEGQAPIWFTRFDACQEIVSNGELFWHGAFQKPDEPKRLEWDKDCAWDHASAEEGMKRHAELRKVLIPFFMPRTVARWETRIREVANELLDRFSDQGEADFLVDFARYYFPYIGAELMGAPREDWDRLVHLEHEVFKIPLDSDMGHMLNLQNPAMDEIVNYVTDLIENKHQQLPEGSFLRYLAEAKQQDVLTREEALWAGNILALGSGHTTTSHLGYIFKYLVDHPEYQRKMVEEPGTINNFCEEILRLYSLFGHVRSVTQDTVFHGVELKKGDSVFVCYTQPNRDERNPKFREIDFNRPMNQHLAFAFGWRQCLGMHFARKARVVAVEEWHKRIPAYRLKPGCENELVEQVYAGVGYHNLPLVW